MGALILTGEDGRSAAFPPHAWAGLETTPADPGAELTDPPMGPTH